MMAPRHSKLSVESPAPKWHHIDMATMTEERERITMRVPKRMRRTLEEAASLSGATVNQFMLQTAYQQAQRMLEMESAIRLRKDEAEKMWELIKNPPKPNANLKKAFADFKKNVRA
jgi:uncharacterized protein (DUF1778 family)